MGTLKIGTDTVGDGFPCYIVAEIGINHNGDVDHMRSLTAIAASSKPKP